MRHTPSAVLAIVLLAVVGCGGPRSHSTDWPEGTPRQRGQLDGYKPVGAWLSYHGDGSLASEGTFIDGRQEGRWSYGLAGGAPAGVGHWRGGIQHGWWSTYSADHRLTSAGLMWEGRRVGPWLVDGVLRNYGGAGTQVVGADTIRWSLPPKASVDILVATTAVAVTAQWDGPGAPWNERLDDPAIVRSLAALLPAQPGQQVKTTATSADLTGSATAAVTVADLSSVAGMSAMVATSGSATAALPAAEEPAPATAGVELTPLPPLITYNAAIRLVGRTIRDGFVGDVPAAGATSAPTAPAVQDPLARALLGKPLPQTRFPSSSGGVIDLTRPAKTTVVVIMRGFSGSVCLYCAGQTAALADALGEFTKAGIDVVVIYPGPANTIPAFTAAVQQLRTDPPPMPVGLDVNLLLVQGLGIAGDLSKPTSLIVARDGTVSWAYIGSSMSDRPSVADILAAARATP